MVANGCTVQFASTVLTPAFLFVAKKLHAPARCHFRLWYGSVRSAGTGARARLLQISGLSPEVFDAHYWRYRLDYDRGTLNGQTYWPTIARDAGVSFSPTKSKR